MGGVSIDILNEKSSNINHKSIIIYVIYDL